MEGLTKEILRESLNFSRAWVAPTDTEDRCGYMPVLASEEWPQPHVHCELSEVQPRRSFRTQKSWLVASHSCQEPLVERTGRS